MAFNHNSTVAENEPEWGSVEKPRLPMIAHANYQSADPQKKTTWRFPHHWIQNGGGLDADGVYTTGEMFLHRGGLAAARSMVEGGRSGAEGTPEEKAHLEDHAKTIGMGDAGNALALNQEIPTNVPEWVMIARTGQWRGHPAGPETITPAHLAAAKAAFDRRGADLVIDWHHQSITASGAPGPSAPAGGWIKEMQLRAGGTELWGRVQPWVEEARLLIASREYRYLSPVLRFNAADPVTGAPLLMQLHSVALTNTPFMTELQALNEAAATDGGGTPGRESDRSEQGEETMSLLEMLAKALGKTAGQVADTLGLDPAADDGKVAAFAVAAAAKARNAPVVNDAIAALLAVPSGADEKTVKAAIGRLQLDSDGTAVRAALGLTSDAKTEIVLNSLVELQQKKVKSEVDDLVANAVDTGKVSPAKKEAFRAFAVNDIEAARELVNGLRPQVSPAGNRLPGVPVVDELSDGEKRVAAQLGLSKESMIAARAVPAK